MPNAGLAGVTSLPAAAPNPPCLEIGQPFCEPSTGGATCGCGALATPGRGCPNSTGVGARLYCHGAFDLAQVDRVWGEDLPAGATTLFLVLQPFPLQTYNRDPLDPCGSGWNTSNGVLFSGGL